MDLKDFLKETKNLQTINTEFLRENPTCVKFIRVLSGFFQREFASLCGLESKRISEYELGTHKPQLRTAKKILNKKITKDLRKIKNFEDAYNTNIRNLTNLRLSGFGKSNLKEWRRLGYISGYKGAETAPVTEQERKIMNKLRKINKEVKVHVTITDDNRKMLPINVDLFVKPDLIILLRKVVTTDKNNLNRHAAQLALDGFRLKKRKPQMKVYCVFEAPKIPQKAETILNESLDWWTTSSKELINKIR